MKTWTCINCETNNKDEDIVCLVCGEKKLVAEKKTAKTVTITPPKSKPVSPTFIAKYCNQCGKPYNMPTSKFCDKCGKPRY